MPEEPEKVDLKTPDLAAERRAIVEELLPGVIADGVVDATRLGELLHLDVATPGEGPERYGLVWAGKRDAIRSLLRREHAALHPAMTDSTHFDTARHVFVEGDNLESLKLVQRAYNDKIRLIYIDPPYNTTGSFVYDDDFTDGLRHYLAYTGQLDSEGRRLAANAEHGGRRHSRWLSMMYPRLVLARNLLSQDGVLLCSINDIELPSLTLLLREIFGEENFLATFIWHNDGNIEQQSKVKYNHEYIVAFARNIDLVARPTVIDPNIPETSKLFRAEIENSITKNGPANPESTVMLPRGFPASEADFDVAPRDEPFPRILDPIVVRDGKLVEPARLRSGWSSRRLLDLYIANRFVPIDDAEGKASRFALTPTGAIYLYKKRSDTQGHVLTVLRNMGTTKASSSWLQREWGVVFDFPKPERLVQHLVAIFTKDDDLILDFFAGSGTTMHAVSLQNDVDGGRRRSISITLPEPIDKDSKAGRSGFTTVADISLTRQKAVLETSEKAAEDGLRVFRLQPSGFLTAQEGENTADFVEHTLDDAVRDWDALAAEVLLQEGVTLHAAWERKWINDTGVIVADGIAVVLSDRIDDDVVSSALRLGPRVVVFFEDGFAGVDAVKANAVTNARHLGITMKTV